MQNNQGLKVVLVEHLVNREQVLGGVMWPVEDLRRPCHEVALQSLVWRQPDRPVHLQIVECQQGGSQDR